MIRKLGAENRELLLTTGVAFLLRALGACLAFVFNVALGRLLGAEGAGLYFTAMGITLTACTVARLGLGNAMLRFIAANAALESWGKVKGVYRLGMRTALLSGLAFSAGLMIVAPVIANQIFDEPQLTNVIRGMSLAVLAFSLMTLHADSLKGLRYIRSAMTVSGIIYPIVALLMLGPLVAWLGAPGAGLAYAIGTATAALIGAVIWSRSLSKDIPATPFERPTLFNSARPLMTMEIINQAVLPWAPLFMLGIWGSTADTGLLGVATRLSTLLTLLLAAVSSVLAPRFASLHQAGQYEKIGKLARLFGFVLTLLTAPLLAVLVFAPGWVMGLFGPEFVSGGMALAILALGQLVNVMTSSVSYILMMTGHERDNRNAAVISMICMFALGLGLIPEFGLIGAALTSAITIAMRNLICCYMVWKRLNIITLPIKL